MCGASLTERKRLLGALLRYEGRVRLTEFRQGGGKEWLERACAKGWEGLLSKRAKSRYLGKRSREWLKLKCSRRQEFVIGGYTDPQGSRTRFGALLLGYYEGGLLRYAGKVGTGFDERTLEDLGGALCGIEQENSPFAGDAGERAAHYVAPKYVCEIEFAEWTRDGRLRHPRYLGIREDKNPREVVREA